MSDAPLRALVCSSRQAVIRAVLSELKALDAVAHVGREPSDWPTQPPAIVFLDLEQGTHLVRTARRAFGQDTRFLAVVDNDSASRLIGAFSAGCDDYLFFPINSDELKLIWRKHVESTRSPAPSLASSDRVALEFPSDVAYLEEAVAEIVRACEEREISGARARLNLRVALGEAVANAILYGNRQDPFKRVRVRAEFASDRVAVTVTDEGSGFDPAIIPDPTQPEHRWRSHGRGLFLLQRLMDAVEYNEVGNAVTLILLR
jgi:serine/threonine-protein kinase RsbW